MNHKQIADKYGITEGPWCLESDFDQTEYYVCHKHTVCDGTTVVNSIKPADARCISLLPDLIKAAEETITWWGDRAECKSLNDVLKRMRGER